jgi:hypothetical protein
MASVTLTLTDDPGNGFDMSVEYGDEFDPKSEVHAMMNVLVESILSSAKSFKKIEDTATEANVEPSNIILPPNQQAN